MNILASQSELLIKAITGEQPPKVNIDWISGNEFKKNAEATYLAACHAIMTNNVNRAKEVFKVACEYKMQDKILKFANLYKEKSKPLYALDNTWFPIGTEELKKKSCDLFKREYHKLLPEQREKVAHKLYDTIQDKKNVPIEILIYTKAGSIKPDLEHTYRMDPVISKIASLCDTNKDMLRLYHTAEKIAKLKNQPIEITDFFTIKEAEKKPEPPFLYNVFERALGTKLASQIFPNGEFNQTIFNTLPKSDKELLDRYAKQGIS